MSNGCPFCAIIRGDAPGHVLRPPKVVRDYLPSAIVLRPLNPVTDGHVLVIPNRHVRDAFEDPMTTAGTMAVAVTYANETGVESANIITSIGRPATQSVFHLHVHVVPRSLGDDLPLPWTPQQGGAS